MAKVWSFLIGAIIGGAVGVVTMCVLQINREDEQNEEKNDRN